SHVCSSDLVPRACPAGESSTRLTCSLVSRSTFGKVGIGPSGSVSAGSNLAESGTGRGDEKGDGDEQSGDPPRLPDSPGEAGHQDRRGKSGIGVGSCLDWHAADERADEK